MSAQRAEQEQTPAETHKPTLFRFEFPVAHPTADALLSQMLLPFHFLRCQALAVEAQPVRQISDRFLPPVHDPLKETQEIVLDALQIGRLCMSKKATDDSVCTDDI